MKVCFHLIIDLHQCGGDTSSSSGHYSTVACPKFHVGCTLGQQLFTLPICIILSTKQTRKCGDDDEEEFQQDNGFIHYLTKALPLGKPCTRELILSCSPGGATHCLSASVVSIIFRSYLVNIEKNKENKITTHLINTIAIKEVGVQ